jgi:hypothetical protein
VFLFFDIETSDLLRRDIPLDDQNQPWIVTIAAELTDRDGTHISGFDTSIRADGRKIRPSAEKIHGVSNRSAARQGVNEVVALGMLIGLAAQADYAIGYSVEFDRDCVASLLMRRGKGTDIWMRPGLQFIDLQKPSAAFCKIPSERDSGEYQWPSLDDAHHYFMEDKNTDSNLVRIRKIFFRLLEHNALEIS